MIKLKNIFKEEVEDYPFDAPENNFLDYDELDVEDDDEEEFLNFLKSYSSELQEANCNCVYEAEYQGR
jgi:hypothetical protein